MSGVAMGTRYSHLTLVERCRLCGLMEMGLSCIGLDLIGQLSDLGVCLRASDRSAQQATATGWLC